MIHDKAIFRNLLIVVLAAVSLASCYDDSLSDGSGVEGEETVISLKLSLPEMKTYTRADLPDGVDDEINNLWVGIFNAKSGECTFSRFYEASDLTPLTQHATATLQNIETKSGNSYIVAVANVDYNKGVSAKGDPVSLRALLEAVETYDDYLAIAVVSSGPGSVSTPAEKLAMSGIYYENAGEDPGNAIKWETLCDTPAYIPVSKSGESATLPGAIHLRRLTSQIKFDISVADKSSSETGTTGTEIISLEPYQWQVFNVPEASWLHERGDGTGAGLYADGKPEETTNAGDIITSIHSEASDNYGTSDAYGPTYIMMENVDNKAHYKFDFWQMENKRVGVAECMEYSYREKRYDENGYVHEGNEPGSYKESTAVYASLCNSADNAFPNNLASYVQIKCRIKYKEKTTESDPTYEHTKLAGAIRTADVTYTIHLGYVNESGELACKAQDFRSLRNSKYTYNVKVYDVKNLIVEAYREGEKQPGAEGVVADVKEEDILLDAHYQQFNVSFTEDELKNCSFLINAYYDGEHKIVQGKGAGSVYNVLEQYKMSDKNKKFWDWVEFRATDDKNKFAEYKPVDYAGTSDKQTFTLKTLCNLYNKTGDNTEKSSDFDKYVGSPDNGKYWFTVFVNENVYTDGNGKEDPWKTFVNQSPRKLYINVKEQVASDGHTMYIQSKYAVSQRSIQTYYSTTAGSLPKTAMGLEHVNESLGLRLRWTNNSNRPDGDWDHTHGRANLLTFLDISTAPKWTTFVNVTKPFSTPEIRNGYQSDRFLGQNVQIERKNAYLPSLVQIDQENDVAGNGWYADPVTEWFNKNGNLGDDEYYIHVINACMNRNRDLNGNGKIDDAEVRWYVPTSSRYLRMIIGSRSLETPLMDFTTTPNLTASSKKINGINNSNTRYHYATSDARIVWAEEGLAVSDWLKNGGDNGWIFGAWEVRCARNLGADYGSGSENADILPAYTVDTKNRTITMDKYDTRSVRDVFYTQTPAVHALTSTINSPYRKFEYDTQNLQVTDVSSISEWYTMLVNRTDPCSSKNKEKGEMNWRVPVMAELAILRSIYGGTDYDMTDGAANLFANATEGEVLLSCTKEYYSNRGNPLTGNISDSNDTSDPGNKDFWRFMGANYNQTYAVNVSDFQSGHTFWVRCVRDVQ